MHDGSTKILTEVRCIPKVKKNLISLGVLESTGYFLVSSQGKMRVMKGSEVVMLAERRNTLYYLLTKVISGSVNLVQKDSLKNWHLRMGHLGEVGLKELIKK